MKVETEEEVSIVTSEEEMGGLKDQGQQQFGSWVHGHQTQSALFIGSYYGKLVGSSLNPSLNWVSPYCIPD